MDMKLGSPEDDFLIILITWWCQCQVKKHDVVSQKTIAQFPFKFPWNLRLKFMIVRVYLATSCSHFLHCYQAKCASGDQNISHYNIKWPDCHEITRTHSLPDDNPFLFAWARISLRPRKKIIKISLYDCYEIAWAYSYSPEDKSSPIWNTLSSGFTLRPECQLFMSIFMLTRI